MPTPAQPHQAARDEDFEAALARVGQLVRVFHEGRTNFLSSDYSEQQVRLDFVDKLWIALGWDVNHELQCNPYEQEVKVERNVLDHGRGWRADYAFLAANFRDARFFVEAKRPGSDIDTADNYFQVIRYGWNSHTPLSVLMSFAQFRVLDCRYKPNIDSALAQAISDLRFDYTQFTDRNAFAKIYYLFSRSAVVGGSLEKYAEGLPKPSSTAAQRGLFPSTRLQPVDESFLEDLDDFRESLAKSFKRENQTLDSEQLTEVTQRTLDRLVFMRFLEDKLIEPEPIVERLGDKGSAWQDFVVASRRLDRTYNGIIFKDHPLMDSPRFHVEDRVFEGLREELAHTNSPYAFHYIPIHILGSIYERFLAKTIIATTHQARVDWKPENLKAHGVYYTPEYIVRYIVQNTVGSLIADKSPEQIAELRFADIACGSGSFLLGIYDALLRRHTSFYNQAKHRKVAVKDGCVKASGDGTFHLSLRQKRNILLNNVYGVDIDPQAVEVAQLSLYLKLLDEETTGSARHYQMEFGESLLPNLSRNIICGNSLVGWDILDGKLFDHDEEKKLRPLDFDSTFPQVFARGGFDAIIGNPPYVRQEGLSGIKRYLAVRYSAYTSTADLYVYFMERAIRLLRQGGRFGYIVSSSLLRATYAARLRNLLRQSAAVLRIVNFGGLAVFNNAKDTYVCIPLLAKVPQPPKITVSNVALVPVADLEAYVEKNHFELATDQLSDHGWILVPPANTRLFEKIQKAGQPLGEYVEGQIFYGIKTGLNEAFFLSLEQKNAIVGANRQTAELVRACVGGEDIRRYRVNDCQKYLVVIPAGWTSRAMNQAGSGQGAHSERAAWKWFEHEHPRLAAHLLRFAVKLRKRDDQGEYWWELRPCDYYGHFSKPKIVFPDICKQPRFHLDRSGLYLTNTAYSLAVDDEYLLALLNSRLFWFAISNISIPFGTRAGEYRYRLIYQYMEKVPIRRIDRTDAKQLATGERIRTLAREAQSTAKDKADCENERDLEHFSRRFAALDRQIDQLVFQLYDLTSEEISLIEQSSGKKTISRTARHSGAMVQLRL